MYKDVWKKILAVVVTLCLVVAMVQLPTVSLHAESGKSFHLYQYGGEEAAGMTDAVTAAAVFMTGKNEQEEAEIFEGISFDVHLGEYASEDAAAIVTLYTSPTPGNPASGIYVGSKQIEHLTEGTNRVSFEEYNVELMKGECFSIVVSLSGTDVDFYTDVFQGEQKTFVLDAQGAWEDMGDSGVCVVIRGITYDKVEKQSIFKQMSAVMSVADSVAGSIEDRESIRTEEIVLADGITPSDGIPEQEKTADDEPETLEIKDIATASVTLTNGRNYMYTGAPIEPEIDVWDGTAQLAQGTDYTVSYSADHTSIGSASLTVTGINNYTGTQTVAYQILPTSVSIDSVSISEIPDQIYTGSGVYPLVEVIFTNQDGVSVTLTQEIDYTLTYANNVAVGTATVAVIGKGLYSGTTTRNFNILQHPILSDDVYVSPISEQPYTGGLIVPEVRLTYGGQPLVEGTDYTLNYSNNIEIGTATITITGTGNFSGSRTLDFAIVSNNMNDAVIEGLEESYSYTGAQICPTGFLVSIGGRVLEEGTDYTVSYGENREIGTGSVIVTGAGFYKNNSATKLFKIVRKDLSDDDITVDGFIDSFLYTGEAIGQEISVSFGINTLKENQDYIVHYVNNKAVGTAIMTLTGTGNYTGQLQLPYAIYKVAAIDSDVEVGNISSVYTYTGEEIRPQPKLTRNGLELVEGVDYDLQYENNLAAGIATLRIVGKENCPGVKEVPFTIIKRNIYLTTAGSIGTQVYTGKDIEPGITVSDNGKALVMGKDYVVNYQVNREPGTAVAVIKGVGNYTAVREVRFDIRPGAVATAVLNASSENSATISWSGTGVVTGYEIYRADASGVYERVARQKSTTYTDSNLTKGTTYYYKVRAYFVTANDTYYGSFSPVVTSVK